MMDGMFDHDGDGRLSGSERAERAYADRRHFPDAFLKPGADDKSRIVKWRVSVHGRR